MCAARPGRATRVAVLLLAAWAMTFVAPARADVCFGDCVGRFGVGVEEDLRAGAAAIFDPAARPVA